MDADGFARTEDWAPGLDLPLPELHVGRESRDPIITDLMQRAAAGEPARRDSFSHSACTWQSVAWSRSPPTTV